MALVPAVFAQDLDLLRLESFSVIDCFINGLFQSPRLYSVAVIVADVGSFLRLRVKRPSGYGTRFLVVGLRRTLIGSSREPIVNGAA